VLDLPEPVAELGYVVVKVMASTLCGTERHVYEHGIRPSTGSSAPVNSRHGATGVVWKTVAGSTLRPGDRFNLLAAFRHCGECRYCVSGRWILCQNEPTATPSLGYRAQYVRIREDFCLPLPYDVDFETGALFTDQLATALNALRRLRLARGETVLVSGQGPVGLVATLLATFLGTVVIATDFNGARLGPAKQCGARHAVNPARKDVAAAIPAVAQREGVNCAIECSGGQDERLACFEAVRRGGRVAFVGLGDDSLSLDAHRYRRDFFLKDLELHAGKVVMLPWWEGEAAKSCRRDVTAANDSTVQ
jgi:threonine dehydrogenase-like Zn-dependent dehydrogenase